MRGVNSKAVVFLAIATVPSLPTSTALTSAGPRGGIYSTYVSDVPAGPRPDQVIQTALVQPVVRSMPDGSIQTTYDDPDGSSMIMITPPEEFDPLSADEKALEKYGFPLQPADAEDYEAWYAAMKAYRWTAPSSDPFEVAVGRPSLNEAFAIQPWGGYVAGTFGVDSHTYVAVKANFHVPTNSGGTCTDQTGDNSNGVGFWIGIGGYGGSYQYDNLVQQGIECGSHWVGTGSSYRPFYEFANTAAPKPMCGQSGWTVAPGDVIYQNMSFQSSQNRAFFYTEDQTTGVTRACNYGPPTTPSPGWHFNGNSAEWIGEAPAYYSVDFGSVTFTNARAELYSNSSWVTLGSQPHASKVESESSFFEYHACIRPGAVSSGTSFVDSWISPGQCKDVPT